MKSNYINQFQRDIMVGFGELKNFYKKEQAIISIENKAEKHANKFVGISSTEKIGIEKDFIAGANEMLPIVKELGEALKESSLQLEYLNNKFKETGTTNATMAKIQTTLDKYKDYIQ